jgi:hypothetical protein
MRRLSFGVMVLLPISVFLSSCENNPTTPGQMGTLQVSLTDAPAVFEAVNITFSEISAHIDSEWVAVRANDPITVNLLEWNNGKSIVLGTAEVPSGDYTQIRLKIDSTEVVIDGKPHGVTVPSDAQTGLKLVSNFSVVAGSTFELIIDFDAQRSVVTTGPPNNPDYLLQPTIRVEPLAITGSISGLVSNPESVPFAYAIAGSDTVTSTKVDTSGAFRLAFLPAGSYTVALQDSLDLTYVQDVAEVVAGSDNDLGTLTLQ